MFAREWFDHAFIWFLGFMTGVAVVFFWLLAPALEVTLRRELSTLSEQREHPLDYTGDVLYDSGFGPATHN